MKRVRAFQIELEVESVGFKDEGKPNYPETRRCWSVYLGVVVLRVCLKFVMCIRDMWVVQWSCIFEGLV